jgi:hypothetical protein
MSVVLTGWYETEQGATLVDETGENLNEIVCRLVESDVENFGHTDMELELHLPDGEVKLVEHLVHRMVTCHDG